MVVFFLLVQVSFLLSETIGYRSQICSRNQFPCETSQCIFKHEWCDRLQYHCGDKSDETFCKSQTECDEDLHFYCKSNSMCIPKSGYCDGYSSCPDESDEVNCPCITLNDEEGVIARNASIGNHETQQMCWRLITTEKRYLKLSIQASFYLRTCREGNITVTYSSDYSYALDDESPDYGEVYEDLICPTSEFHKTYAKTIGGEVKIRYRSSYYEKYDNLFDVFNITYNMVDRECLNTDSFKCSENSCIMPEKLCDGNKDCENGRDEDICDLTFYVETRFKENLKNAVNWMRSQRNADWGWKENTGRAVVALQLGDALNFIKNPKEDDLIAKQLELEVSARLLRSKFDKMSPTELSVYINALLAICHDPKNFFGLDLIQKLKKEIENEHDYVAPLPYLTLCNAKENVSSEVVSRLLQILEKSSDHGFILEIQALSIMALSCISQNDHYVHLKENITEALNDLKQEQREDGSFGNEYTTSLVIQAFIANNQTNEKDWNFQTSIEFLLQKQKTDGSFGDFLTTYLVMPIFNSKSMVDVGKMNCTDLIRPKEGNLIFDIKSRLGEKIPVKYSLFIGDDKDQIHPIFLRVPESITVFEVMTLAADLDPKYMFKTHEIKKKMYVYEIFNLPNDPENNQFWFLYHDVKNETVQVSTQAPDEIRVHENDHIIMWYKTLTTLWKY